MDGTGEMRTMRDKGFFEGLLCGCAGAAFGGFPRGKYVVNLASPVASYRGSDVRHLAAHRAVME